MDIKRFIQALLFVALIVALWYLMLLALDCVGLTELTGRC
jgi:hypothetical protein